MADKGIADLLAESQGDAPDGADSGIEVAEKETSEQLQEKLVDIEIGKKEELTQQKSAQLGMQYIDLVGFPIGPEILSLIDEDLAKEAETIAFFHAGEELRIATTNPDNPKIDEVVKSLQQLFPNANIEMYVTSAHSLEVAMTLYAAIPKLKAIPKGIQINQEDIDKFQAEIEDFKALDEKVSSTANMTDVMVMLLSSAMKSNASDIHIEAEEKEIVVRFRVDGMLHVVATMKKEIWERLAARVKGVSGLIINVSNVPQDGRITIFLADDKLEIRVSTMPSAYGESVVMRLLKSTATSLGFEDLGIRGRASEQLTREIERPNGMIVTTGPTGSGKTTTLYAILSHLNKEDVKIITLENPIEYKLPGITQSQINHEAGYTFADGLRSILRQDPDIVMVGEIRDLETAQTAANAALTGHLVISTVHTNDAAGAIPRFLAMGLPPFQLAPAINAILGQRLVRKLCKECIGPATLTEEQLARVKSIVGNMPEQEQAQVDFNNLTFKMSAGCDACNGLGYKGRLGIYEVLTMSKEIEDVILSGTVSEYQMRDLAKAAGMVTMAQDGILKALDGMTSVEEIFRVTEEK